MEYAEFLDHQIAESRRQMAQMYREIRSHEGPAAARALWRRMTEATRLMAKQMEDDLFNNA